MQIVSSAKDIFRAPYVNRLAIVAAIFALTLTVPLISIKSALLSITGLAVGAFLVRQKRTIPFLWLISFIADATISGSFLSGFLTATFSILTAYAITLLITIYTRDVFLFDNSTKVDLHWYIVLACTALFNSIYAVLLLLLHSFEFENFWTVWSIFALRDIASVAVFTPLVKYIDVNTDSETDFTAPSIAIGILLVALALTLIGTFINEYIVLLLLVLLCYPVSTWLTIKSRKNAAAVAVYASYAASISLLSYFAGSSDFIFMLTHGVFTMLAASASLLDLWLVDFRRTHAETEKLLRAEHNERQQIESRSSAFERLVDNIPVALWFAEGPECTNINANKAALELFEVSNQERNAKSVNGTRLFAYSCDADKEVLNQVPMSEVAATGVPLQNSELTIKLKNGRLKHLLGSIFPHDNPAGQPAGCIAAFLDITRKKVQEERQAAATEQALISIKQSEQYYRRLVELSPDAILLTSENAIIEFANQSASELFGVGSPNDLVGKSLFDVTHVDYHAIMRQRFKLILEGQAVPALDKKIVRPDGSLRDVEVNARHYTNTHRRTVEITLRNVTERKQTEEAFRESEARFRRIYESNMIPLAFSSMDGRLIEANQAFCNLIGHSLQEIRRGLLTWHKIISSEWHPVYDSVIDEIKSNKDSSVRELTLQKNSNVIVPVIFGASVVRGSIVQIATFIVNASEMRRREEELRKKEEKYRLMVDNSVEAMITVDSSGRISHFNNRAQALFGYSAREVLGRQLITLFTEHSHDTYRRIRISEPDSTKRTTELIARRSDGTEFPIEIILSSWNVQEESLITAQVRDITERKRAEDTSASSMTEERTRRAEAETSERRARILAEASATLSSSMDYVTTLSGLARITVPRFADLCAVYVLNEDNTIRRLATEHVNPTRMSVLAQIERAYPSTLKDSYGPAAVLKSGKALWRAQVSDSLMIEMARNANHLALLRQVGLKSYMIVPMTARNRTLGVIEFAITESNRYYNASDLALAEDLAQRAGIAVDNANLYKETQEALFTAQKAVSSRDELIAIVSHDLKNPLSAIGLGASAALKSLDAISHSASRMNRLISDLLDIASIDARNLSIRRQPTNPSNIVDNIWQVLEPAATAKQIHFTREVQPDLPLIDVDPVRIEQVLSNLVGNSLKFTPSGGSITIHVERHGHEVLFSCSDTGPGIPPEHFEHIFDRHWQAKETAHLGTGLGLAIAKGIVESHGGQIWVTSNPGHGSSFHFTLAVIKETDVAETVG